MTSHHDILTLSELIELLQNENVLKKDAVKAMIDARKSPELKNPRLLVFVHGWMSSKGDLSHLETNAKEVLKEADEPPPHIRYFEYDASYASTADPNTLSQRLSEDIRIWWEELHKPQIVCIGHSAGALLLRKAFLISEGLAEPDEYGKPNLGGPNPKPRGERSDSERSWSQAVDAMVLLASPNRGWHLSLRQALPAKGRQSRLPLGAYLYFRWGTIRAGITFWGNYGRFMMSFRYGAPFVANLRLLVARHKEVFPNVYFLLGNSDPIVGVADYKDSYGSAGERIYVRTIENTEHKDIIFFAPREETSLKSLPENQRKKKTTAYADRKAIFRKAISGDTSPNYWSTEKIKTQLKTVTVLMLHGVRVDTGAWVEPLATSIDSLAKKTERPTEVWKNSYGWFPTYLFVVPWYRERKVRWFMDQFTQFTSDYPASETVFIGHSFGTYIFARALQKYSALQVGRILLVGSILHPDFPWDKFVPKRIQWVRNDCQNKDIVIALTGPGLLKKLRKFGASGLIGFKTTTQMRQFWMNGWHSFPSGTDYYANVSKYVIGPFAVDDIPTPLENTLLASKQAPNTLVKYSYYVCEGVYALVLYYSGPYIWQGITFAADFLDIHPLSLLGRLLIMFG